MISNFHDGESSTHVDRKQKDGTVNKVPCPEVAVDYNKNMNFVDRFEQYLVAYKSDRKVRSDGTGSSIY